MAETARVEPAYYDRSEAVDSAGEFVSADIPYFVFNVSDETEALESAVAYVPEKYGRLYFDEAKIEERINANIYKVIASYVRDESKDAAEGEEETAHDPQTSFDTSGGTRHINRSHQTVSIKPDGAPNYSRAIEVDNEGNVNGIDVTMPVMQFSETHYLKPTKMTDAYKKTLFRLTGTMNKSAFRGFAQGECLFLGASANRQGTSSDDLWEVTYKFAVSPNKASIDVGNNITVTNKYGWDYLWVKFGDKVTDGMRHKVPVAAYVERVYEISDFAELKLESVDA